MPDMQNHHLESADHSAVLVSLDPDGTVFDANETFYWLAGLSPAAFQNKCDNNVLRFIHPDEVENVISLFFKQFAAGSEVTLKFHLSPGLNDGRELTVTILVYRNEGTGRFYIWMPVSRTGGTFLAQYGGLLSLASAAVVEMNRDLVAVFADDSFYSLTGYTRSEYEERFGCSAIPPHVLNRMLLLHRDLTDASEKSGWREETFPITHKNGTEMWISVHACLSDSIPGILTFRWIIEDITPFHSIEDENRKLRLLNDLSEDVSFEYSIADDILTLSQNYETLTGFPCVYKNLQSAVRDGSFIVSDSVPVFLELLHKAVKGKPCSSAQLCLQKANGSSNWVNIFCTTVNDAYNKPSLILGKLTNIDSIKKERDILVNLAETDPLTKFYNKNKIKRLTEDFLMQEPEGLHAFYVVDIDNFKAVNDTMGHLYGDLVLTEICAKLSARFEQCCLLGRIGGDEFVLFAGDIPSEKEAAEKAAGICDIFCSLESHGSGLSITCSVGVALCPKHGRTYNELFAKADVALYKAKHGGKNRYELYKKSSSQPYLPARDDGGPPEEHPSCPLEPEPFRTFILSSLKILLMRGSKDENINRVLNMIGIEFDLSRIYIIALRENSETFFAPFEWHSNITASRVHYLNALSAEEHRHFLSGFNEDGVFFYTQSGTYEPALSKRLREMQAKSALLCAYYGPDDQTAGYVGFDSCETDCLWHTETVENLTIVARLLGLYAIRGGSRSFRGNQGSAKASGRTKNTLFYIIQADSYELQYLSERMQREYPGARLGQKCYQALFGLSEPCLSCPYAQSAHFDKEYSVSFYNEQQQSWVCATSSLINWRSASPSVLVTYDNITRVFEKINYTDNLTGLSSLTKFKIDAQHLLNGIMKDYAVVCVDFVNFKDVNASLGYEQGDKILRSFARFLTASLNEGDLVCRAHDDNFILLIEYTDREEFKQALGVMLAKIVSSLKSLYHLAQIRCVAGVCFIAPDDTQIIAAIDKANVARKNYAGQQRNGIAFFNEEMGRTYSLHKELESRMFSALTNHEFIVYLQPKIDLKDGQIIGAEALVRWDHPVRGILPPADFIPLFEENGFIVPLDYEVYELVCQDLRRRLDAGKKVVPVSVNISRLHIQDPDFTSKLIFITQKYQIPVDLVEFELTESAGLIDAFEELNKLIRVMRSLHSHGFSLSMDDFGSGYSSLSMLKDIPVDIIKLDRSFLNDAGISGRVKIVLESIIEMCKKLNIKTLSEGVVKPEQLQMLDNMGCDMAQGFLFARPMPVGDFYSLLDG